mmetsp:Transcript_3720/g.6144  ORF Transcript_3720/g.6144 Transcript_3720/m.6144 type:complete len:508 (-) Transcript_3720:84-1607(-)
MRRCLVTGIIVLVSISVFGPWRRLDLSDTSPGYKVALLQFLVSPRTLSEAAAAGAGDGDTRFLRPPVWTFPPTPAPHFPMPAPAPTGAPMRAPKPARVTIPKLVPMPSPTPAPIPAKTQAPAPPNRAAANAMGTTTTTRFFLEKDDRAQFADWKKRVSFEGDDLPRVLMYTWCTEDTFWKFQNENYWKSCYAHLHGFDIVFSQTKNFTGVAVWTGDQGGAIGAWYNEENMWAWWWDIQNYLFSGKYDYVFLMGVDVLLNGGWFWWPVWRWDRGHDITIMDQHSMPFMERYGLNENNVLWRPTQLAKDFINEGFSFRKQFNLQGENGPYMETILRFVGRAAEAENRTGYSDLCLETVEIPKPSPLLMASEWWMRRNDQYDRCFFEELERMVGGYGTRDTKNIGFYPTFISANNKVLIPEDFFHGQRPYVPPDHPHRDLTPLGPWANCWSSVIGHWKHPSLNCFAYHFNGPKDMSKHNKVSGGTCPDPTFDWEASPYHPANRPGAKAST